MAIFKKFLSLLSFTTMFLIMLLNNALSNDVTSFTYDSFSKDDKYLIFQGTAKVNENSHLELTQAKQYSVGRILYSEEVQLWKKGTDEVSTFETTIKFNISSPPSISNPPADGWAFFIAAPDSTIPKDSYGGYLGLFDPDTALDSSKNKVVAVEFDTYSGNTWDPSYRHIGIDVNSIKSVETEKWERQNGAIGTVRIDYNSDTKSLTVVSSYPGGPSVKLNRIVDLKSRLPEKVRVGLSASTGPDYVDIHTINSWYFTSTLVHTNANNNNNNGDMYIKSVV